MALFLFVGLGSYLRDWFCVCPTWRDLVCVGLGFHLCDLVFVCEAGFLFLAAVVICPTWRDLVGVGLGCDLVFVN